MSEMRCELCRADFRSDAMVEGPAGVMKCRPCALEYPLARTREEIQTEAPDKAQTLSEKRVREIVYEIVYGVLENANIKRHKCESCSAMFFRHAPMQAKCHKCEAAAKGAK